MPLNGITVEPYIALTQVTITVLYSSLSITIFLYDLMSEMVL